MGDRGPPASDRPSPRARSIHPDRAAASDVLTGPSKVRRTTSMPQNRRIARSSWFTPGARTSSR